MLFFNSNKNITKVTVKIAHTDANLPGNTLIDVREINEYNDGHAAGAINIPLSMFRDKDAESLKKYNKVYVICQSGARSMRAVTFLLDNGVQAINVIGGTMAWRMNNLPMK